MAYMIMLKGTRSLPNEEFEQNLDVNTLEEGSC